MIHLPITCRLSIEMYMFVDFFNRLEKSLEFPHCSGYEDRLTQLKQADTLLKEMLDNLRKV